jgi:hypothetical protein
MTFLLFSFFIMYADPWAGLHHTSKSTVPIDEVAQRGRSVADGVSGFAIKSPVNVELALLVDSFNHLIHVLRQTLHPYEHVILL